MAVTLTVALGASQSGLSTVGYQLRKEDGTNQGSRITAGISDTGGGGYSASVTTPALFIGAIDWDNGAASTRLRHAMDVVAVGNNAGNSQFQMSKFSEDAIPTPGYQLFDNGDVPVSAHITAGIVNFTNGYYGALVTVPNNLVGYILWDDGAGVTARLDVLGPNTGPPGAPTENSLSFLARPDFAPNPGESTNILEPATLRIGV